MNKILILLALTVTLQLQAQDINAKLGGNTANETYDITDSGDNLLFRVQGDGKVGIGTTTPLSILSVGGNGTSGATIFGQTSNGTGIWGSASTTVGRGVYGRSSGINGRGVVGAAENSITSEITYGGYFESWGKNGRGVFGIATHTGAYENYGGYFEAAGTSGRGVYGYASAPHGVYTYGGYFKTEGDYGRGTYGEAVSTSSATNYGGFFKAAGGTGRGVYGEASNASGVNYGVYGKTNSSTGWAGYFEGRGYFSDNVGIGTTTPDEKLHVAGNMRIDGTFEDKDGNAGSAGQILSSTGTGTDWIASTSGADNLGNHTATQDINMASFELNLNGGYLSGDGDNEGIFVDNDGDVGIGTASPLARLHVSGDDGFLAQGTYGNGATQNLGAGTRMHFYSKKGAFRAGYVGGTEWDDANMGSWSIAMGVNPIASGNWSSVALGNHTKAVGASSFSVGYFTDAEGSNSVAMGNVTKAISFASTAIGSYNIGLGSPTGWNETDPILEIGIGIDLNNKKNAMTVLKNGNVGIGTTSPVSKLSVGGEGKVDATIYAEIPGQTGSAAVYGVNTNTGDYYNSGGYFKSLGQNGRGVTGFAEGTSEPVGVLGTATGGLLNYGGSFWANGDGYAVKGHCLGDGYGVYGSGQTGVFGDGWDFGVRGKSISGWAGYFEGKSYFNGNVGIGTTTPNSKLSIVGLSEYTGNVDAIANGLVTGDLYRTDDLLKIVH